MKKIWLSPPHVSGKEILYIKNALEENWIAPVGPDIDAFESELALYTGRASAAAVSSCTAALHLALRLLNVGRGDYVACQSLTFVASANPILYQRAMPVFVDSEPESWGICPEALATAIKRYGKRLKAVIGVHLYGMPCKIDDVLALCDANGIPFIEDAAGALGSSYRGRRAGSFGTFSTLSFNGNKIITTSGGGALLSDSQEAISRARYLAMQAKVPGTGYRHSESGYNYRMSNICAGIGRGQMEVLSERIARRRANFDAYRRFLSNYEGVCFQSEPEGVFSNRWLTAFTMHPKKMKGSLRDNIMTALDQQNIESRAVWRPMHLQPVFKNAPYVGGCVAEKLSDQGICLPSGSNLTETDLNRVIYCMEQCLAGKKATAAFL